MIPESLPRCSADQARNRATLSKGEEADEVDSDNLKPDREDAGSVVSSESG
jgi:hypothetical protein